MFDYFLQLFSLPSVPRAFIVGPLVALCASLLGVSLVLKRYSMIGDGLSHVGFGTMSIAAALNTQELYISVPVVVIAAFFLLRISENSKIKGDTAIAVISSGALAIGVMVAAVTKGISTDLCTYMFGSILVLSKTDARMSIILSIIVIILFVVFYNRIFAVTFDEMFSRATGTKAGLYNSFIAFLTAITVVIGMRLMGAMLISSLIIFPSLTSMRLCKTFRSVMICSAVVSVMCFLVGAYLSCAIENISIPTGASIVIINMSALALFAVIAAAKASVLKHLKPESQRRIPAKG